MQGKCWKHANLPDTVIHSEISSMRYLELTEKKIPFSYCLDLFHLAQFCAQKKDNIASTQTHKSKPHDLIRRSSC